MIFFLLLSWSLLFIYLFVCSTFSQNSSLLLFILSFIRALCWLSSFIFPFLCPCLFSVIFHPVLWGVWRFVLCWIIWRGCVDVALALALSCSSCWPWAEWCCRGRFPRWLAPSVSSSQCRDPATRDRSSPQK